MIKISRLADYGTLIMDFLVANPAQRYSASQIAKKIHLPIPTVSKILKLLNEARLVNSSRGVNGGYQLSRSPAQITLADVVTAIDGKPAITECNMGVDVCSLASVCQLRDNWHYINRLVLDVLSGFSLADMNQPLARKNIKLNDVTNGMFSENC